MTRETSLAYAVCHVWASVVMAAPSPTATVREPSDAKADRLTGASNAARCQSTPSGLVHSDGSWSGQDAHGPASRKRPPENETCPVVTGETAVSQLARSVLRRRVLASTMTTALPVPATLVPLTSVRAAQVVPSGLVARLEPTAMK